MTSYAGEVRYKRNANRDRFFQAIAHSSTTFKTNVSAIYKNIVDAPGSRVRDITYREGALPIKKSTENNTEISDPNYAYKVTAGDLVNPTDGFASFSAVITVPSTDDYVTWSWTFELPQGQKANREYEYVFAKIAYQTLVEIDQSLL